MANSNVTIVGNITRDPDRDPCTLHGIASLRRTRVPELGEADARHVGVRGKERRNRSLLAIDFVPAAGLGANGCRDGTASVVRVTPDRYRAGRELFDFESPARRNQSRQAIAVAQGELRRLRLRRLPCGRSWDTRRKVRASNLAAHASSCATCACDARTSSVASSTSPASIATAVCDRLCGSTPIITAISPSWPPHGKRTTAGTPDSGGSRSRTFFEPHRGEVRWAGSIVRKPDANTRRQAVREPTHRTSTLRKPATSTADTQSGRYVRGCRGRVGSVWS